MNKEEMFYISKKNMENLLAATKKRMRGERGGVSKKRIFAMWN
ncbi:hypothetical protein [Tannerella forsythia]|nr:hypothetical protein [Tannerella forsythia]